MTKTFAAQQIRLNLVDLMQGAADPSSGGGVAGAIGSFYLRSGTGQAWLKTGAGNAAWSRLVQSFAWYSVKDYGAIGNGVADDTTAIQQAITDCNANGGGVVYFPPGTYAVTQLALTGTDGVQLIGCGAASSIKWAWNAATAAGSLLTISAGAQHTAIRWLKFDGAGLSNPAASRANHLIAVGTGAGGAVTETHIEDCLFTGMVANSGDGVHVLGAAGNLVSRLWIAQCQFDGCSRFGVGHEQGWEYGWIVSNYFTNNATDIGFVSTADVNSTSIVVLGNEILHTGSTRYAVRFEGGATQLYTKLIVAENIVLDGFVTYTNVQYGIWDNNVHTSGAFASADAMMHVYGSVSDTVFSNSLLDRASGAAVGPNLTMEISGGASPTRVRIGHNALVNETVAGNFINVTDCTLFSIGGNTCSATNADASVINGFEITADTVALTGALIGPGNNFSAMAGTFWAGVRVVADGSNVNLISVVGNVIDNADYGCTFEKAGAGTFTTSPVFDGNNVDSTATADFQLVGFSSAVTVGANAGASTQRILVGSGSPEGAVSAGIGSIYMRTDGGQATAFYYKETGSGATGWIGVGGAPIVFGTGDTTTAATGVFMAPGWIAVAPATEIQMPVTRPGTVRNLRVQAASAGTTAETNTYTVRKNAADTALVTTIANDTAGGASDTTHSFSIVAGDTLGVRITKTGVVVAGQGNVTASMEIV